MFLIKREKHDGIEIKKIGGHLVVVTLCAFKGSAKKVQFIMF